MASAYDVAKQLIHLAGAEEEPDLLSHLRLQKLLYYVQGWSLAMRDKPMFIGRIEAWANGPVVKKLYPKFAAYGFRSIPLEDIGHPKSLTHDEMQFICQVWKSYRSFSASSLREMTHSEAPWIEARGETAPGARSSAEITHASLKKFFKQNVA